MSSIRVCRDQDRPLILGIINHAAEAYRGRIPAEHWHEPYMSDAALAREIAAGVEFWAFELDGNVVGVMGLQHVRDIALIRHAYVLPDQQQRGVGSALIEHSCARHRATTILVGTWAAAEWAIRFYRRHGFELVEGKHSRELLATYWTIPPGQADASVVLARFARGDVA